MIHEGIRISNSDSDATVTALLEISNAVNNTDNLDDLYASIHESLNKILNLENFAIAIYHEEKDSMTFPYFVDELDTNLGEVFDISKKQSLSARVINAGKPLMGSAFPKAVFDDYLTFSFYAGQPRFDCFKGFLLQQARLYIGLIFFKSF